MSPIEFELHLGSANEATTHSKGPQMIDIEVDRLTNSIEEVSKRRCFDTLVARANLEDLKALRDKWLFDWVLEQRDWEIYKLIAVGVGGEIQGLISLRNHEDHVFVKLVESHPQNVGRNKRYEGVPGNLFAFAAMMSLDLGYDGYVAFVAKSELIGHYAETLGAKQLGRSPRMCIDRDAAARLINQYFGAT